MKKTALVLSLATLAACVATDRTAAAEQSVTGTSTVTVWPSYGYPSQTSGASSSRDGGDGSVWFSGGSWDVPVGLEPGRSYTSISLGVYAPSGDVLTVQLVSTLRGQIGSAQTTSGFSFPVSLRLALSCSPCAVLAGEQLVFRYTPTDATSHRADAVTVTTTDVVTTPPMGNLPLSRTLTLNAGDAIPGSLINEIQDVQIADHTAIRTRQISIGVDGPLANIADVVISAVNGVQKQITPHVGETIVAARATIKDSATGPSKWAVLLRSNDPAIATAVSTVATGAFSTGAGTQQPISVASSMPVLSGKSYYVALFCSGATDGHLYALEYDYVPVP